MSVKPYIQYGVGIKKSWGDRFSGWAQIVLRNGGTNGIAAQLGLKAVLGKSNSTSKSNTDVSPVKPVSQTVTSTDVKTETKVQPTTEAKVKTKTETKVQPKTEAKIQQVKTKTLVPDINELQHANNQSTQVWPERKIDLSSFSK